MGSDYSNITIYPEDDLYLFFEKFGKKVVGKNRLYFVHLYSPQQDAEIERLKLKPANYGYSPPLIDIDSYDTNIPQRCIIEDGRAFKVGIKEQEQVILRYQKGVTQESFRRTGGTLFINERGEKKYSEGFSMFDLVDLWEDGKLVESSNALKVFSGISGRLNIPCRGNMETKVRNANLDHNRRFERSLATIDKMAGELEIPPKLHSKIYSMIERVEKYQKIGYQFDVDLPVSFEKRKIGKKDYIFLDVLRNWSLSELSIDRKNWKLMVADIFDEWEANVRKLNMGAKILRFRDYGAEAQVKYIFSELGELEAANLHTVNRRNELDEIIFGQNMVRVRADLLINGSFQERQK